jgi:hypothetical protein
LSESVTVSSKAFINSHFRFSALWFVLTNFTEYCSGTPLFPGWLKIAMCSTAPTCIAFSVRLELLVQLLLIGFPESVLTKCRVCFNQLKTMQTKKLLGLGSILSALMCAGMVHASVPDTLVLTEYSPTDLTATWNGSTSLGVLELGSDSWGLLVPDGLFGGANWEDPDGSGNVNFAGSLLGVTLALSDVPPAGGLPLLPNDATDTTDFTDLLTGAPIYVTFDDVYDSGANGGTSALPDSTTTLPLLGMAFAGLCGFAKRLRK